MKQTIVSISMETIHEVYLLLTIMIIISKPVT